MRGLCGAVALVGAIGLSAPAQAMPTRDPHPAVRAVPCDPGMGKPVAMPTCPDRHPLIGDVLAYDADTVTVQPLTVYWGDEARAYGATHGLDVSNDYVQLPEGDPVTIVRPPDVICTAAIRLGYSGGSDHPVPCRAYRRALEVYPVTSALWFDHGLLIQISELYRP